MGVDTTPWVGIPWAWNGLDRTGVDCYGLVRLVYAAVKGVRLPAKQYHTPCEMASQIAEERVQWREVAEPAPLDVGIVDSLAVSPDTGRLVRTPTHLCVWLGDGMVMESVEPIGVVVRPVSKRVLGWYAHD